MFDGPMVLFLLFILLLIFLVITGSMR
jgi:hypothetical protein